MQKKTLTVKKVLTMGAIIGLCVIAIAYFIIYTQHRKVLEASRGGTLPKTKELASLQFYTTDNEGNHSYVLEQQSETSRGNIRAWSRLIYTQDGKNSYIQKRKQRNIFVDGFDQLAQREILYEFKCTKDPREYAIIEVFEVDGQGKTLDYGKTGSSKDWEAIPQGTTIEKLAQTVCPSLKK
jgi:hypothetical protein